MDNKSKNLVGVFFILIIISIIFSYYRYIIKHDYVISSEAACDPGLQKCFVRNCEEEAAGVGCDALAKGEKNYYYKIVERNYRDIDCKNDVDPRCVEALPCQVGERDCREIMAE